MSYNKWVKAPYDFITKPQMRRIASPIAIKSHKESLHSNEKELITMKMKKTATILSAFLLAATCVACGSNTETSKTDSSVQTTTVASEATTTEAASEAATTTTAAAETTTDAAAETSETEDATTSEASEATTSEVSEETINQITEAAQAAAKSAADDGKSTDEIAEVAAKAAAEKALELGVTDPGTVAPIAGQAAGMNGGNGQAAGSTCAELIAKGASTSN